MFCKDKGKDTNSKAKRKRKVNKVSRHARNGRAKGVLILGDDGGDMTGCTSGSC